MTAFIYEAEGSEFHSFMKGKKSYRGLLQRAPDVGVRRATLEVQVVADRHFEEQWVLRDQSHALSEGVQRKLGDVFAVNWRHPGQGRDRKSVV